MPYKLRYNDADGTPKEENMDDILNSPEFKSWSPADKADFIEFAHSKAVDSETEEQPDPQSFIEDSHRVVAGAPRSLSDRMGQKAVEYGAKALGSVYTDKFREKYARDSQTVTDWAGENFGETGRAVAGGASAIGGAAMEMTSPMDVVPMAGHVSKVAGLTPKISAGLKAARGADMAAIGKTDLGALAKSGLSKGAEMAKSGAARVGDAITEARGMPPVPQPPRVATPAAPGGIGDMAQEAVAPLKDEFSRGFGVISENAADANRLKSPYELALNNPPRPVGEKVVTTKSKNFQNARSKWLMENPPDDVLLREGEVAPRGEVRPVSEPGAKPSKPVLEETPRKIKEEPLVEPASETPVAPGTEVPQGSAMAQAAKPIEMSLADSGKVDKGVAVANEFEKRMSSAIDGKAPEVAPVTHEASWVSRKLQGLKQKYIDPAAHVEEMGWKETHSASKRMNDRAVQFFSEDAAPAQKVLKDNIKTAEERALWNDMYNLKSMDEAFKVDGLDYGQVGSKAEGLLNKMKIRALNANKGEMWTRVEKAVEEFADATREIGLSRVKNLVGEEKAAEWANKYRYYRSFQSADAEATKFMHGEEGVIKHSMPSLEDIATGFMKKREGGGAITDDVFEAFQKSHWRKVTAGLKKEVVDTAIKESYLMHGKELAEEFSRTGGKGWTTFKAADGEVYEMPDVIVDFLTKADPTTTSLFNEIAKTMNPMARRGYLDMNVRYYPGMVLRDISDTLLRSKGYLTPQTEWIAKKIGGAAEAVGRKFPQLDSKLGLSKFQDAQYDVEYLLNPGPWLRAIKSSWRVNFSKAKSDEIYNQIARGGGLQTGTIQHAMKSGKIDAYTANTPMEVAKKAAGAVWENMGVIMKAWDDTLRIGQTLRNVPKDYRGFKNIGKMLEMESLPVGPEDAAKWADIVRNTNIDFKMMGQGMRDLKWLNPFINPAIQDKFQTLQHAKDMPVSFALTSSAFLAAASTMYMKWKGKPEGRRIPPTDFQRFILVDTGIRSKEGNPYTIPAAMIPDSIQPMWVAMRNALDIAYEKSPEFRKILKENYVGKTLSQTGGAMANISGPVVAGIETLINHSFYTGRSVEGRYNESLSKGLRAGKDVPNIYRLIGEKTGMSPDKMSYLARGVAGAPGVGLAGAADSYLSDKVALPKEGTDKKVSWKQSLTRKVKSLPKAMGLVREGKFDTSYQEMQEFLEPSMRNDADARRVIGELGKRFGQEKDPQTRARYQKAAWAMYEKHLKNLKPGVKQVDFNDVFVGSAKEAIKSAATGMNRTVGSAMNKYRPDMAKILGRTASETGGELP